MVDAGRRRMLLGTLALAAAPWARAVGRCADMGGSLAHCRVGLPDAALDRIARQQPAGSNWCWAACLEMVFALHGYRLPMARIVRGTYGREYNLPADSSLLARLLSSRWQDEDGRTFDSRCEVLWDAATHAASAYPAAMTARQLAAGRPLLLGARNHAMLLTGLAFSHDGSPGSIRITAASVLDPAPGRGRRALEAQEVAAATVLIAPAVAPA